MARLKKNIKTELITLNKEEIVKLLTTASKWGGYNYTKGVREKQNKLDIPEFNRWRKQEMLNILENYLKER